MRILFVSNELIGGALCQQLSRDGHDVKLYIGLESWKECLLNLVTHTENWQDELDWVGHHGLIVFDDVNFGALQDELRIQGYRVIGGSAGGDQLELDRVHFQGVMRSVGCQTLPSYDFHTIEDAIQHVEKQPGRWVIKQNGHLADQTYIGKSDDGRDVVSVLRHYQRIGITDIHLQCYAKGVEVGVGRYFNGHDWLGPIELNIEHKRLCNGDIGPLTGEMGTLMRYSDTQAQPLFDQVLCPLTAHLKDIDFRGDIAINCIVSDQTVWPLEATARFGWPATSIQCGLHLSPWGEFLSAVADGKPYELSYRSDWGVGVVLGTPPFPYQPSLVDTAEQSSTGIIDTHKPLSLRECDRLFFDQVRRSEQEGQLELCGQHGISLQATGFGKYISDARDEAYALVNKLIVPKAVYRTDIGERFRESEYETLKDWGWLLE